MTLLELDLSFLFLVAVILIWFMIAYQFMLTAFGYVNFLRSLREQKEIDGGKIDYPSCAILIPARNEETVIARTLDAMLQLDYPADRLTILVINDGSTDRTGEIVAGFARQDGRVRLYNVPPGEGGKGKSRVLNLGIAQVAEMHGLTLAADYTEGFKALIDPMGAKITFLNLVFSGTEPKGIEGAGR